MTTIKLIVLVLLVLTVAACGHSDNTANTQPLCPQGLKYSVYYNVCQ